MKIELYRNFTEQLNAQADFIARDKPVAARRFKAEILKQVSGIAKRPFSNRRSVFFPESEKHRDLIYKGYKVVYRVEEEQDTVFVIGLVNMQRGLTDG